MGSERSHHCATPAELGKVRAAKSVKILLKFAPQAVVRLDCGFKVKKETTLGEYFLLTFKHTDLDGVSLLGTHSVVTMFQR